MGTQEHPRTSGDPRSPHVVQERNLEGVAWGGPDGRVGFRRKKLAMATGGQRLGCTLAVVEPGKRACPYHTHMANEEAIYVLEGEGIMRLAGHEFPITVGDYITCLVGEAGTHQVINTSDRVLRYLVISTMREPDITLYPDSNKLGVYAGAAPGGPQEDVTLKGYLDRDATVDYWHGEAG